jgi:hypothetical protein
MPGALAFRPLNEIVRVHMVRELFLGLAATLSSGIANADESYKLIRYSCDVGAGVAAVTYAGAVNEAGEELIKAKGQDAWEPRDLVEYDNDGFVRKTLTIRRKCGLSDGEYEFAIIGKPGNGNIQGECGAEITAELRISRSGKVLYRGPFEGHCHANQPVVVSVSIRAGSPSVAVRKMDADEFFK